jgi:hypothetical protein
MVVSKRRSQEYSRAVCRMPASPHGGTGRLIRGRCAVPAGSASARRSWRRCCMTHSR